MHITSFNNKITNISNTFFFFPQIKKSLLETESLTNQNSYIEKSKIFDDCSIIANIKFV